MQSKPDAESIIKMFFSHNDFIRTQCGNINEPILTNSNVILCLHILYHVDSIIHKWFLFLAK